MTHFFRPSLLATLALGLSALCSVASAKLPAPSPEAAEKAAEAAAKAAWAGKVASYQLCQSQDRAAAHYRKTHKDAKSAIATPACADPGAFAYTPAAPKPAEAVAAPKS